MGAETQGTNDAWLVASLFLVDDAQSIFFAQGNDQLGKVFVTDAAAELAVESVGGGLAQWVAIDVLNGTLEGIGVEERAFDGLGMVLESFVGAVARTGRPTELPADRFLFHGDVLHTGLDEGMVVVVAGHSRSVRSTLGGFEDGELRFSDRFPGSIDPGEGVVALGGVDIYERAGRLSLFGHMGAWSNRPRVAGRK